MWALLANRSVDSRQIIFLETVISKIISMRCQSHEISNLGWKTQLVGKLTFNCVTKC